MAQKSKQSAPRPATDGTASAQLPGAFQLFNPSRLLVMENLGAFLWLLGLPLVVGVVGGMLSFAGRTSMYLPGLALTGLGGLLVIVLGASQIVLKLKLIRQEPTTAATAFREGLRFVPRYVLLTIVLLLMLCLGAFLLVVPFFLLLPRVLLAPYFMIDQNLGVFAAISASFQAYKQHKGIWGIIGVNILLSLPAIIPVIGTIVTLVLRFLYDPALAFRYEHVKLLSADKPARTSFESEVAGK